MHCRPDIVYRLSTWDCVCVSFANQKWGASKSTCACMCTHTIKQRHTALQENTQTHPHLHAVLQDKHTSSCLPSWLLRLMPRLTHSHKILHISCQFCSCLLHRISPHSLGSLCEVEEMCGFAFCASERHRVYIIYPSSSRAAYCTDGLPTGAGTCPRKHWISTKCVCITYSHMCVHWNRLVCVWIRFCRHCWYQMSLQAVFSS